MPSKNDFIEAMIAKTISGDAQTTIGDCVGLVKLITASTSEDEATAVVMQALQSLRGRGWLAEMAEDDQHLSPADGANPPVILSFVDDIAIMWE